MLFGPLTLQEPAGWEWNQHPELNHFSLLFLRQMKSENLCLKQRDLQSAGAHRELFSGTLWTARIPFQQRSELGLLTDRQACTQKTQMTVYL